MIIWCLVNIFLSDLPLNSPKISRNCSFSHGTREGWRFIFLPFTKRKKVCGIRKSWNTKINMYMCVYKNDTYSAISIYTAIDKEGLRFKKKNPLLYEKRLKTLLEERSTKHIKRKQTFPSFAFFFLERLLLLLRVSFSLLPVLVLALGYSVRPPWVTRYLACYPFTALPIWGEFKILGVANAASETPAKIWIDSLQPIRNYRNLATSCARSCPFSRHSVSPLSYT